MAKEGANTRKISEQRSARAKGLGEGRVEREPMNIGYTAPKNALYDRSVVVTVGRGERQWKAKKKTGIAPR